MIRKSKTIAAAVSENRSIKWSEVLKSILESKVCSPDQAAECAGRLGFACTIACGQIGRAFVKLFHAQSHAPLVNFTLSPSLANAAEWWSKFLSLAPAVKLSVDKSTRYSLGLDRCFRRWRWFGCCGILFRYLVLHCICRPRQCDESALAPRGCPDQLSGGSLWRLLWIFFRAMRSFASSTTMADGPSRNDCTEVIKVGAVWIDPVLPGWMSHLWVVD